MQLILIVAVLGVLAALEAADGPASWPVSKLALVSLTMFAAPLWAAIISRKVSGAIGAGQTGQQQTMRRFIRLRAVHTVLWLSMAAAAYLLFDWPALVRFNAGLDEWILLDELMALVPLLLPLILSWGAFYDVDRAVRVSMAAGLAQAGEEESPAVEAIWSRGAYLLFQLRTHLAIVLLPLLILLATQDLSRTVAPEFSRGEWAWLAYLVPLAMLLAGFPLLLKYVWRTESLPAGALRQRLEQAAARWDIRVRDIVLWRTEGMIVNAAVAGFLPRMRYVFLSDALVEHLDDDEIEAVFGHEAGHIHHRHVVLRGLVLLFPVALFAALRTRLGTEWLEQFFLDGRWLSATTQASIIAATGAGAYIAAVFGFFSRYMERQADLFGCRVSATAIQTRSATEQPTACSDVPGIRVFISALEKLARLSGTGRRIPSWQHGSIARRVAFLEQVAVDPATGIRCQWQLRILGSLIVGAIAACIASVTGL